MNITAMCYSHKVVGPYCERYNKGLIEKDLFYQKVMKLLKEENTNTFNYLPFIFNKIFSSIIC